MKYYIIEKSKPKQVSSNVYEKWMVENKSKYKLPEYGGMIGNKYLGIETMFMGAIDKDEEVLPFLLLKFEADYVKVIDENTQTNQDPEIDYFATFEELEAAYNVAMEAIKKKIEMN